MSHLIVRGSLCHGLVDSISARILSLYCKWVSFRRFFLGTSDANLFDLFGCCHAHSNYASGGLQFESVMTMIRGATYPQGSNVVGKAMNNQGHIPVMYVGMHRSRQEQTERGRRDREKETKRERDRESEAKTESRRERDRERER